MRGHKIVIFSSIFLLTLLFIPFRSAEAKMVYSAWIPYWKKTSGAAETQANLSKLGEISPFAYYVSADGTLIDKMVLGEAPWPDLFKAARAKQVKILPSILWTDGDAINKVLTSSTSRQSHIKKIMAEVTKRNFDGIDIDYENKLAATNPYFSIFLRDLGTQLHANKKILSCTIEARTPPASRYLVMPKVIEYANDYKALNKYCDQVRLMTYDQGSVDIKLNMGKRLGGFYYPVADPAWVRKVIDLAQKEISPKKLVLGVATYGYELEVTDKTKFFDYAKVRSLSYLDLKNLATQTKISPFRNNAGELSLTYRTADGKMRFASFSDSRSMADKIRTAKLYGLRGVAIFKIDGESDPGYWQYVN